MSEDGPELTGGPLDPPATAVVVQPVPAAPIPDPPDTTVTNSGFARYKPCVLCLRVISVFDTSAGCQDQEIGRAKGCDRLEAVEADTSTSGTDVESPASDSNNDVVSKLEAAVQELESEHPSVSAGSTDEVTNGTVA